MAHRRLLCFVGSRAWASKWQHATIRRCAFSLVHGTRCTLRMSTQCNTGRTMRISDTNPGDQVADVTPRPPRCPEDSPLRGCMHHARTRSCRCATKVSRKPYRAQLTNAFPPRFKVMDDDAFQKDRMISWACFRLDRFPVGLQLLTLHGIEGKPTGGKLLVSSKIVYKQ